jgi:hypothetical protein
LLCYENQTGPEQLWGTANAGNKFRGWSNHGLQCERNIVANKIMAPQWSRSSSRDTRVSTPWVETDREAGRKAGFKGCHNQAQNAAEQG